MTALVVYLQNTIARLRERQEGQTMAEYALSSAVSRSS